MELFAAEMSEKIAGYLPRQGENEPVINRLIPHIDFIKLDLSVSVEDSALNRLKHKFRVSILCIMETGSPWLQCY